MPVAQIQSPATARDKGPGEDTAVDDLPDQLTVGVGEEALLGLPSLAAAGYKWQAVADDPAIVGASITFEEASPAGAESSPSFGAHELLVVRGRAPGSSRVRCLQRRSWETAAASADHSVTVHVVAAPGEPPTTKGSR